MCTHLYLSTAGVNIRITINESSSYIFGDADKVSKNKQVNNEANQVLSCIIMVLCVHL